MQQSATRWYMDLSSSGCMIWNDGKLGKEIPVPGDGFSLTYEVPALTTLSVEVSCPEMGKQTLTIQNPQDFAWTLNTPYLADYSGVHWHCSSLTVVATEVDTQFPDCTTDHEESCISPPFLPPRGRLFPGDSLKAGQQLASGNGRVTLNMQGSDGNLVLRDGNSAVWDSGTQGHPGASLAFQGDGNLVIYDRSGKPLWNSRVDPSAAELDLQGDCNLVVYDRFRQPRWSSGSHCKSRIFI